MLFASESVDPVTAALEVIDALGEVSVSLRAAELVGIEDLYFLEDDLEVAGVLVLGQTVARSACEDAAATA